VVRVLEQALGASSLDRVLVAADDPRILRAVAAAGGEARSTPVGLASGSDRAAFAARELAAGGERFEVIVNIQGDEPFLPPEAIDAAVALLGANPTTAVATLGTPLDPEALHRPDVVKAVLDPDGRAVDFLRTPPEAGARVVRHVGLYAYRARYLERFVGLRPSRRETVERLEQHRILADGAEIRVAIGSWPVLGVDTPRDLEEARRRLAVEAHGREG